MTFVVPMTVEQIQTLLALLSTAPDDELLNLREEADRGTLKVHPEAFEFLCAEVERRGLGT